MALPHTALDYASVDEGHLLLSGVPGLRATWHNADWTLYRVTTPTPLVSGARVLDVGASEVTIEVPVAATVVLRLRWTPSLTVEDPDSGLPLAICPIPTSDGMTQVPLPAGRWRLAPDLERDTVRQLADGCAGNAQR